jgi:chromosome segregation ATPase
MKKSMREVEERLKENEELIELENKIEEILKKRGLLTLQDRISNQKKSLEKLWEENDKLKEKMQKIKEKLNWLHFYINKIPEAVKDEDIPGLFDYLDRIKEILKQIKNLVEGKNDGN